LSINDNVDSITVALIELRWVSRATLRLPAANSVFPLHCQKWQGLPFLAASVGVSFNLARGGAGTPGNAQGVKWLPLPQQMAKSAASEGNGQQFTAISSNGTEISLMANIAKNYSSLAGKDKKYV
jgi:hypothetical protein